MAQQAARYGADCETAQLVIRPAKPDDVSQIMAIERASFPTPWSEFGIRREIRRPGAVYLVANIAHSVVGYCGMWIHADEAHIPTIAVHPQRRRRGIATALMLAMLEKARDAGARYVVLEYRPRNRPAKQLYDKIGFRRNRIRKRYYHDTGEDAVEMIFPDLQSTTAAKHIAQLRRQWVTDR